MWRVARLVLVAAMLICASARPADPNLPGTPGSQVSPYVVPLARLDGWQLRTPGGRPEAQVALAYDLAAARALWASTRAADAVHRDGPGNRFGVSVDVDRVDFAHQLVLVLESGGSGSCPPHVVDVRRPGSGGVEIVTGTDGAGGPCTADLDLYTEIVAVDRDRLPPAASLRTTPVTVDGTRIEAVTVVHAGQDDISGRR